MAGSGQCDGRHANGRGFPGLAPPRCHPGPPSLSLSESSSPARECAQGRGARGEVARPARAAIPPPPVLLLPPRLPGRGFPKGRGGGVSGGAAAVTEAAPRAQRSARVNTQPDAPAGRGGAGGPHPLPTLGTRGATECARSARAKLADAAPPRRLLPPLPARRSPLLAGPTPPSSDSSRVPSGFALPQPSRETGGGRCAEQRGARLRGRD